MKFMKITSNTVLTDNKIVFSWFIFDDIMIVVQIKMVSENLY